MPPAERVRRFLDAMSAWERRVFPQFVGATEPQMRGWADELRAIFDAHLSSTGKGPKNWGKKLHPTRGIPTNVSDRQYDQEIVGVEPGSTKASCYVLARPRQDPHTAFRFKVVVDTAGVPWVDAQQWCVVVGGEPRGDWKSGLH